MRSEAVIRHLPTAGRILLGLPLFVGGLNGFLHLLPEPTPQIPEAAGAFLFALVKTGYMLQLIFATQLVVGALLLANRFVPLALALLAPFIVNSVSFHVFLEPSGLPIALVFAALEIALAWKHRSAFRPMLAMRSGS